MNCKIPEADHLNKGSMQRRLVCACDHTMIWRLVIGSSVQAFQESHLKYFTAKATVMSFRVQSKKQEKKQSGFTHNTLSSTCMHLLCIVCVCSCKRSHMCLCTCVLRGKGRTYHRGEATEVLKWITVHPVNSNTRSVLTEYRFLSPPSVLLLPHISDLCAS